MWSLLTINYFSVNKICSEAKEQQKYSEIFLLKKIISIDV